MTTKYWPFKDPDEVLDYEIDWTNRLELDVIATSTFSITSGHVTVDSSSTTDVTTTVWLSGGTLGEVCEILNRIVTVGGRTMDQSVKLKIKAK